MIRNVKKILMVIGCILIGVSVMGCAPQWNHPNPALNNEAQFMRDNYECQGEAMARTNNMGFPGNPLIMGNFHTQCMRMKGWVPSNELR